MLAVNSLSVQYTGRYIFHNISFQINEKDIVGLVGLNGAGKSTLLKILAGIQLPDEGEIQTPKDYTVGYLPQELQVASDKTIFEAAEEAFERLKILEDQLHSLQEKIAGHHDYESDDYARLVERLGGISHQYELLGGDNKDKEVARVLKGLGFGEDDFSRALNTFSGGWQMRVELAKILLSRPDLLLLDEPTNHLDIESIIWLENFLKNYNGAVIMVSHDRALLDQITNRTIEIENGHIYDYKSNYSRYLVLRAERREKLLAEKKNQDKYIEHTENLINKFRAKANKAAFAQSLIKKLEKIDRIEVDEMDTSSIKLAFPEPPRSGKIVTQLKDVKKAFGDNLVFDHINMAIERGDKIAFVGKNGEGKTTLSKILAGLLDHEGEMKTGHNVKTGYYAQHQEQMLDGDKTVLQTIDEAATGEMRTKVRGLLGAFLFSGDDVEKKVKVLSGGEKSRLSLAKLLLEPANFLILDEPTNHLDMRSREILKNALQEFPGAMIIVSHDRKFLEGLTGKVYEFRNNGIREYLGDINYFLHKRDITEIDQIQKKNATNSNGNDKSQNQSGLSNKEWFEKKKQLEREGRKLKNQVKKSERRIESLEQKIAVMEEEIHKPEFYKEANNPQEIFRKYDQYKKRLEEALEHWTEEQEKLEGISSLLEAHKELSN